MSSRDNQLWLQLWRDQQTDFHQQSVNPLLVRFWSGLEHVRKSRVFVPLCGKSLDMIWLSRQGHEVIGVELSPIAVRDFFKENRMQPVKRQLGKFTLWQHGNISILCGDYFCLDQTILGPVDTVYDRAALTALPEDIRKLYVAHLYQIIPVQANVFLLTIEDADEPGSQGETESVDAEVRQLYSDWFSIHLAYVETVLEPNPELPGTEPVQAEYKVYQLSRK